MIVRRLQLVVLVTLLLSSLACGGDDTAQPSGTESQGAIEITTNTTGQDPDPDGYSCRLDGGAVNRAIGANDSETVSGLALGDHSVELTGVRENCTVSGANPRTVNIQLPNRPAIVNFDVTCTANVGNLEVIAVTSGGTPDSDGYTITVDGTTTQQVSANGNTTFSNLTAGSHTVELSALAVNCTAQDVNPRNIDVTYGATEQTTFNIDCPSALFDGITFHSDRNSNWDLWFMNTDGSSPIRLTTHPEMDWNAIVSPNGTRVLFTSQRFGGNWEVVVMNADGTSVQNLTNDPAADRAAIWSPDGSKIAFRTDRDGNNEIWVMNADGSSPIRLTFNDADDSGPTWSPDGSKIAFSRAVGEGFPQLYYVPYPGGGNPTQLTFDANDQDLGPAWSPDGEEIAFTKRRDGNFDVWVLDVSTLDLRRLTYASEYDGFPHWSPDGSMITFASERDGNREIYVVNADGSGSPTRLTNNAYYDQWPKWTPER